MISIVLLKMKSLQIIWKAYFELIKLIAIFLEKNTRSFLHNQKIRTYSRQLPLRPLRLIKKESALCLRYHDVPKDTASIWNKRKKTCGKTSPLSALVAAIPFRDLTCFARRQPPGCMRLTAFFMTRFAWSACNAFRIKLTTK